MAKAKTKDTESEKPKPKAKERAKEKASAPRARNDAYVMMLFISLVAMIGSIVLQYLDFEEYGNKTAPDAKAAAPAPPKLGEAPKAADTTPPGPPPGPPPMPPAMP